MKPTLALLLAVLLGLSLLGGCNTMRGMGEDIEQGGEAIQREAS
ncbi:entericidin A/B family lipoprotein [Billgrantia sp. LNSP4103-1]